jgi:hypothetical protein
MIGLNKMNMSSLKGGKLKNVPVTGTPEFLKEISGGNFRLRKLSANDTNIGVNNTMTKAKNEFAPPSLNELLLARSRLKKTCNDDINHST